MILGKKITVKPVLLWGILLLFLIVYGISIMNRSTDYWVFQLAAQRLLDLESITRYENMAYSYPPLFAVLMLPITLLPTWLGSWIFYFMSLAATVISIKLTLSIFKKITASLLLTTTQINFILIASFLLGSRYIFNNLEHLQFDGFVFLFIILTIFYVIEKRWKYAAFFLALSISFKVTPLLLLVYFLFRKNYSLFAWSIIFLLGLNIIPEILFGIFRGESYNWEWVKLVVLKMDTQHLTTHEITAIWPPNSIMNQSLKPWIYRLFTENSVSIKGSDYSPNLFNFSASISSFISLILSGIMLIVSFVVLWRDKLLNHFNLLGEISLVLCLMLLLSPVSSKPHFVTLIIGHLFIFTNLTKYNYSKITIYFYITLFFVLGFLPPLLGSFADQYAQLYGATTLHAIAIWIIVLFFLTNKKLTKESQP